MKEQMVFAINVALPGWNNLECSVTPIFLLILTSHFFLLMFYVSQKKRGKSINSKLDFVCKMYHQVLFLFTIALCLPAQQFQMPLKRLGFVKMLATFGIIDAMDLLKPNLTRIVCLCWFIFDIDLFYILTLETMLICMH